MEIDFFLLMNCQGKHRLGAVLLKERPPAYPGLATGPLPRPQDCFSQDLKNCYIKI